MKQDKLAVIGAGIAAVPIINKAKSMNVQTVVFGQSDSLAKNISDIFVEKDIFDEQGIYEECLKLKVDGIIASSEISTEIAAIIADRLGLPGNNLEGGFAGRNKYVMRCRVQSLDVVKQPKFELYDSSHHYDFPVVVKSVDSCGKKGVCLVRNEHDLSIAVEESKKYSSDHNVLIEEFLIGGQEYSIECLAGNGHYCVIQCTQKDSAGAPHFVELGHHQPAPLSEDHKTKIQKATEGILQALGINCGMAHLELKIIDNEIYFIEVGARAGGGHIADTLVALSTDFDYYRGAIECSLGKFVSREIKNVAHAGLYYSCKQNERLISVLKAASEADWCYEYNVKKQDLREVTCNIEAMDSGYIIYCADSKIDENSYLNAQGLQVIEINNFPNAYQMIWNHCKEIGRNLTDTELDLGIKKFLDKAHVLAIVKNNHILAFAILYCNEYETLEAYICNVFVLQEYRGLGYSSKLVSKAIEICKEQNFKTIALHVKEDNTPAVNLYKKFGFSYSGNYKKEAGGEQAEMTLTL